MNFKIIDALCGGHPVRLADELRVKLLWDEDSFRQGPGHAPRRCAVSGPYDTVVVDERLLARLAPFNSTEGARPDVVQREWSELLGGEAAASHMMAVLFRAGVLTPCEGEPAVLPLWGRMELEIISTCNRDCTFCGRYNDRSGVRKDQDGKYVVKSMPTEKVIDLLDQAQELGFRGEVGFHRLSEALLDRRFAHFAAEAKKRGMRIVENTNGDVLKANPGLCEKLDGVVDHFDIGLYDAHTDEEKCAEIAEWRSRFKRTTLSFSLAEDFPQPRPNDAVFTRDLATEATRNAPCFSTSGLKVRYDGELCMCWQDDEAAFDLGNAFERPLKELFWSEKRIAIARSLRSPGGRRKYRLCSSCTMGMVAGTHHEANSPSAGVFNGRIGAKWSRPAVTSRGGKGPAGPR